MESIISKLLLLEPMPEYSLWEAGIRKPHRQRLPNRTIPTTNIYPSPLIASLALEAISGCQLNFSANHPKTLSSRKGWNEDQGQNNDDDEPLVQAYLDKKTNHFLAGSLRGWEPSSSQAKLAPFWLFCFSDITSFAVVPIARSHLKSDLVVTITDHGLTLR
ncbi:uncharacterized protein CLUP02_02584 [Colletotrichum lupini]|uniref:Uncharacterized protein n=1 Tax=Colletotrichum lupini TaxID=145971 RepID=A0A9Q8SIH8_9PEZI|nr:uncharacterized protein CLUP02_02584 [Colletotrichum lupini]UQC77117.1 hypothetical protein CLUP02_02584 [Colletotrichum lupini]